MKQQKQIETNEVSIVSKWNTSDLILGFEYLLWDTMNSDKKNMLDNPFKIFKKERMMKNGK